MALGEDTYVALPSQGGEAENTEKSLATMLRSQYLSREFSDVYAATELREHEIVALAGAMSTRAISLILSTNKDDLNSVSERYKSVLNERLILRERMLSDPNAMVFAIQDAYLHALGVCRQSLNRQSRQEGVVVASASINRQNNMMSNEMPGLGQRFLSKIGLGAYETAYVPKQQKK